MRTSTQTDRSLPSLWKVLLVAALVVVAFDGLVRLRHDRMRDPQEYYEGTVLLKDADRVLQEGLRSDVVIVGTSMVIRGVNPEVIEDRLETIEQAHNGAIPAAQTPVIQRWLLEELLPRLGSPRVIWGVSSLDFNGNRPTKTIDIYNSFRATRPGVLGSVDRWLGDVSALSRYRDSLRDPASWGSVIGFGEAPKQPRNARVNQDRLLRTVNATTGTADDLDAIVQRVRNRTLVDFEVGVAEDEAFRSTLKELLAMDIEVVVVLMPVPDRYVDLHPNGEADFIAFAGYVEAVAGELGIPFFDHSRKYPDEDFQDLTHLNGEPADRFSARLAKDLAGLGW